MKKNFSRSIKQYFGISIGAVFFAVAYSWFLVPYKIAPGGVGGLSQILFHKFGIPAGISMLCFNIPLFILSFIVLGKVFGIRSFVGMAITSVFTDIFSLQTLHKIGIIKSLEPFTYHLKDGSEIIAMLAPQDIYLSAITGAALLGLGLGIIFRFRGSTGGTDIPAAIIKQKTGVSLGTGFWIVESFIIFLVGFVFKDIKLIIWGYINLFISAKITDIASEGMPYVKGLYVISDFSYDIKTEIYKQIHRGVTMIKSEGGYTGKDKNMIFCVVSRRQVSQVRDVVKDIDPNAFMILTDVYDVMGLGFKSRALDLSDKNDDK